uniref:SPRY domain-containing SOCS box protein 3 n=1 Tax=Gasterosteus aculeatus aculeatus TaxID=481459 RepID=G3PI41_GASAC
MSRRSRNSRAWRYVWGGMRRDADARALEEWSRDRIEFSDSDSEADFSAVVVPPVPSAVPVTGESYCGCDSQAENSYNPRLRGFHQVKDCHCGEDDQEFDWVWDGNGGSTATLLSCENRKVNFHSDYSCGTAAIRGSRELAEGQHFWEIKMTSPVYGTDMMVGIGTFDVNLDKYRHSFCSLLGKDADSWGLSYTGLLHHKGDKMNFSSRFGQGSIIGIHLDTWHGTLTFFKNRKCIGVASAELQNKKFYPMACSTTNWVGCSVSTVAPERKPPMGLSCPPACPRPPRLDRPPLRATLRVAHPTSKPVGGRDAAGRESPAGVPPSPLKHWQTWMIFWRLMFLSVSD